MKKISLKTEQLEGLLNDFEGLNDKDIEVSENIDENEGNEEDAELQKLFLSKVESMKGEEVHLSKSGMESPQSSSLKESVVKSNDSLPLKRKNIWVSASLLAAVLVAGLVTFLSKNQQDPSVDPSLNFQTKNAPAASKEASCDFGLRVESIPSGTVGLIQGACNRAGFLQIQVSIEGQAAVTQHFNVKMQNATELSLLRTDTGKPAAFSLQGDVAPIHVSWTLTQKEISKSNEQLQQALLSNPKIDSNVIAVGKTQLQPKGNP